jgi:hypothetical protein
MTKTPLVLLAALCVASAGGGAQTWRTMDVSRQLRDTGDYHIRVKYLAGRFSLRPATDRVLFNMSLRYDEERTEPVHDFNAEARFATIGLEGRSTRWARHGDDDEFGEMRLELSNAVPLDLDLELGATKARIDAGGLSLRSLKLETGAAEGLLDFSAPNPSEMRRLSLKLGAAGFRVRNLGNANVSRIRVEGGVGSVDLDFGGTLRQDVDIDAAVALGKISLVIPRDVGVRVEVQKLLASFDHDGLEKRGDAYYSENWDTARVRLRLQAETVLGSIVVDRVR